jgi:hypothetical protein
LASKSKKKLTKAERALCGKRMNTKTALAVFFIWLKHNHDIEATVEESGYSRNTISRLVNHGHRSLGIPPFVEMTDQAQWIKPLMQSPLQRMIEASWNVNETTGTRTMLAAVELAKRTAANAVASAITEGLDGKDKVATCESAMRMLKMAAELEAVYMPKAKAAGITEEDGDLPETSRMSVDELKQVLLGKSEAPPVNVNVGVQLATSTVKTPHGTFEIPDPTVVPAKAIEAKPIPKRTRKKKVKNPSGALPSAGESNDEHEAIRKKLWELGPPDEL